MKWIGSVFFIVFAGTLIAQDFERYHEALLKRPDSETIYRRFETAFLESGSIAELRDFLSAQDRTWQDYFVWGIFEKRRKDPHAALAAFSRVVELDSSNEAAWLEKARVEASLKQDEAALLSLNNAGGIDPEIGHLKALILIRRGDREGALLVWEAMMEATPDDEFLIEQILYEQRKAGMKADSLVLMKQLIEGSTDAYEKTLRELELAEMFADMNEHENAVATCRTALARTGGGTWLEQQVVARIESTFRKSDRVVDLESELKALAALYSNRIGLATQQAAVLVELKRGDEAEKIYQALLERTPGDRGLREEYIGLLGKVGKKVLAAEELARLCEMLPEDTSLWLKLASAYRMANQEAKAVQAIESYLKKSSQEEADFDRTIRFLESAAKPNAEVVAGVFKKWGGTFPQSRWRKEREADSLYWRGQKEAAIKLWGTLASSGEASQLYQVVRSATAVGEHELAFSLMNERAGEFEKDSRFLGTIATTAIAAGQADEALSFAMQRITQASDATGFQLALDQALSLITDQNRAGILGKFSSDDAMPTSLKCFAVMAFERAKSPNRADELLATISAKEEDLEIVNSTKMRLFSERRNWNAAAEIAESENDSRSVAVFRARNGELEVARKWIGEWRLQVPSSVEPWLFEVSLLRQNSSAKERIQVLKKAVTQFPDQLSLKLSLIDDYSEIGDVTTAENMLWESWEDAETTQDKAVFGKRLAALADHHNREAEMALAFEGRVRQNPTAIAPLLGLLEVFRETRNIDGQRSTLQQALKLKKRDIGLWHELSRVELAAKRPNHALAALEEAAEIDSSNRSNEAIARLYLQTGRVEEGYQLLFEAFGGETNFSEEEVEVATAIMIGRKDWPIADSFIRRQQNRFPDDYRINFLAGVVAENLGDSKRAIESFLATVDSPRRLKRVKATVAQSSVSGDMPAGFQAYRNLLDTRHDAYDRISAPFHLSVGYGGTIAKQAAVLALPKSIDEAQGFALHHLLQITRGQELRWEGHIVERLAAAGIDDAAVIMRMPSDNRERAKVPESLLVSNPENVPLHAYWILATDEHRLRNVADEHFYRAFKLLKTYPVPATRAGLISLSRFNGDKAEAEKLAKETVAAMVQVKSVGENEFGALAEAFGVGYNGHFGITAPKILRYESIHPFAMQWFDRLTAGGKNDDDDFFKVVSMVLLLKDGEQYVNLLQSVNDLAKNQPGAFDSRWRYQRNADNEALATPSQFPPRYLVGVIPSIRELCGTVPISGDYALRPPKLPLESIEANLKQTHDPLLRTMISHQVGAFKIRDEAISELSPEIQKWLRSGLDWEAGDYRESFNSLVELADSPTTDGAKRHAIRRVQLYQAREMAGKKIAISEAEMLPILQDLAAGQLSPLQRSELIEVAHFSGFENLADQVAKGGSVKWFADNGIRLISQLNHTHIQTVEANEAQRVLTKLAQETASCILHQNRDIRLHHLNSCWEGAVGEKLDTSPVAEVLKADKSTLGAIAYSLVLWKRGEVEAALEVMKRPIEQWPANRACRRLGMLYALKLGEMKTVAALFELEVNKPEAVNALIHLTRSELSDGLAQNRLTHFILDQTLKDPAIGAGSWLVDLQKQQRHSSDKEIVQKLQRAMKNSPTLIRESFMRSHLLDSELTPELLAAATETLQKFRPEAGNDPRYFRGGLPPEFALARHAFLTQGEEALRTGLLNQLQEDSETAESARLLTLALDFYFVTPPQFQKTANDAHQAELKHIGRSYGDGLLQLTVHTWKTREIASDLTNFVINCARRRMNRQSQPPEVIADYAEALEDLKRITPGRRLVEELARVYLGPNKEKWRDSVTRNYQANGGWSSNTPAGRISTFKDCGRSLSQNCVTVIPWIELSSEIGLPMGRFGSEYGHFDEWVRSTRTERQASLRQSRLLANLPEFRIAVAPKHSIIDAVFSQEEYWGSQPNEIIARAFFKNSVKPATFGSDLIHEIYNLETESEFEVFERVVSKYENQFWGAESIQARKSIYEYFVFLKKLRLGLPRMPSDDENSALFKKLSGEFESEKISELDRILSLRKIPDYNHDKVARSIAAELEDAPEKAMKALRHYRSMIADSTTNSSEEDRQSVIRSFEDSLANAFHRNQLPLLAAVQSFPDIAEFGTWPNTNGSESLGQIWCIIREIEGKMIYDINPEFIFKSLNTNGAIISKLGSENDPNAITVFDVICISLWNFCVPENRAATAKAMTQFAASQPKEPWWWNSWTRAQVITDRKTPIAERNKLALVALNREEVSAQMCLSLSVELLRSFEEPPIELVTTALDDLFLLLGNRQRVQSYRLGTTFGVIEKIPDQEQKLANVLRFVEFLKSLDRNQRFKIWYGVEMDDRISLAEIIFEHADESTQEEFLDDGLGEALMSLADGFDFMLQNAPSFVQQQADAFEITGVITAAPVRSETFQRFYNFTEKQSAPANRILLARVLSAVSVTPGDPADEIHEKFYSLIKTDFAKMDFSGDPNVIDTDDNELSDLELFYYFFESYFSSEFWDLFKSAIQSFHPNTKALFEEGQYDRFSRETLFYQTLDGLIQWRDSEGIQFDLLETQMSELRVEMKKSKNFHENWIRFSEQALIFQMADVIEKSNFSTYSSAFEKALERGKLFESVEAAEEVKMGLKNLEAKFEKEK